MAIIPENQFLCVTGDPRSGTSLMMKTLYLLGLDVAGDKFPQEKRGPFQRLDRPNLKIDPEEKAKLQQNWDDLQVKFREMNPGGFYEVSGVVMQGTQHLADFGGKALKIISPGAVRTPQELVWRYIWCIRDPESVSQSQTKLTNKQLMVAGPQGWVEPERQCNPRRFLAENGYLAAYLLDNPEIWDRVLVINYDDMIEQPETTIKKIVDWLGMPDDGLEGAVANVDPTLRRSIFEGYPEKSKRVGEIANLLFDSIVSHDEVGIRMACDQAEQQALAEQIERTPWYDNLTGCYNTGAVHDRLANDPKYREDWFGSKGQVRKEFKIGLHPECEPTFEGEVEEEYTLDLGSRGKLTRKKVKYQGEDMTWEQAFLLHQRMYNQGKVKVRPLAERVALSDRLK